MSYLDAQRPSIFIDKEDRMLTAIEVGSLVCRMLISVGMVPVRSAWNLMLDDPLVASSFTGYKYGYYATAYDAFVLPFDYPTSETFTVAGVSYRPFVNVIVSLRDPEYGYGSNWQPYAERTSFVAIVPGIRQAGPYSASSKVMISELLNSGSAWGGVVSGPVASAFARMGGCCTYTNNWRPVPSYPRHRSSTEDYGTMLVQSAFAYLGPAGLFLQLGAVGSSLLSIGLMAHGGRIPNRQYLAAVDYNLGRVNPILPLFMNEYDSSVISASGQLSGLIQGMQYNLTASIGLVKAAVFNLENLDWPIWPTYWPHTAPSPRVIDGQAVHVLARPVIVPTSAYSTESTDFGPKVSELSVTDTRPRWEDTFTSAGFRFGDRTAPTGMFRDPLTNADWYTIRQGNTGGTVSLLASNTLMTDQLTLLTKQPYLSDIVITLSDDFAAPQSIGFSVTFTPDGSAAAPESQWAQKWWSGSTSDNVMRAVVAYSHGSSSSYGPTSTADVVITPPPTDPVDTTYEVSLLHRFRGNAQTQTDTVKVQLQIRQGNTWVDSVVIRCPGITVSRPEWDWRAVKLVVQRDPTSAGATIPIRLIASVNGVNGIPAGATYELTALTLTRYRYA